MIVPAVARARLLGDLLAASHLVTLEQLPEVAAGYAAQAGWPDLVIYLADLQQNWLRPMNGGAVGSGPVAADPPGEPVAADPPGELPVEGTVAGRAFQLGRSFPASTSSTGQWWVPLLNGTERLGVLRLGRPGCDLAADAEVAKFAALVALLLAGKRDTSDTYARLIRRRHMDVTSEMEWRLMPPRTFATDRVLASAVMEPAYEISGDAFDYALAGETMHLAVFDAMGHDTAAGLTANVAVSTSRNCRRAGAGPVERADGVDKTLTEFDTGRYVTGILADLNLGTGVLEWVCRGHLPPVVIRGRRTVVHLHCPPVLPMGIGIRQPTVLSRDQLEPGDRLLLYTDGVTEARHPGGQQFGLDRLTDFLIRHHADDLPVPETLRRLVNHHLAYHHGRLNDDATVLLLEWQGPDGFHPDSVKSLVGLPAGPAAGPSDRGAPRVAGPP